MPRSFTAARLRLEIRSSHADAHVARLSIFPFKSLDGVDVDAAMFTAAGGLFNDRRFAFVDAEGLRVNGKRDVKIHAIGAAYNAAQTIVTLADRRTGERQSFFIDDDGEAIAAWVGAALGRPVTLERRDDGGFPDDEVAPGPTIISTATIATVAAWFTNVSTDSMRRRLRTNIEIDGVPAFWEDGLFGAAGTAVNVRIGDVTLDGTNPCQRCVVPSRDPDTAAIIPAFSRQVATRRAATLPAWAERTRFDHFYRLAVNTRSPAANAGAAIRVGDAVSV